MGTWKPIETAPRDGTYILAVCAGYRDKQETEPFQPVVIQFFGDYFSHDDFEHEFTLDEWFLTHWMPLPPLPKITEPAVKPKDERWLYVNKRHDSHLWIAEEETEYTIGKIRMEDI